MFNSIQKLNSQINIDFEEYDLQNGLHVILHQDKTNPMICVDIWYHVGSKDEEINKTGFAHLFEHMMFQGSDDVGKTEHFKYVQNAGGTLNGSTTQDRTNYFETLPSNQLELALWLESDRMSTLKVTQENFDNQREVVKEEKRQRYDNVSYGTRFEHLFSLSFANHPYEHTPIGSMEDLNNASLEDAQRFYKKFYCPNNAVLAVTGDIDFNETKNLVEKYFGPLKPSSLNIERNYTDNTFQQGEKKDTVYENIQLPAVFIAYKIPSITSKENYPLELLSTILSYGKSSRLYKNIVYDKKLAKSINAFDYELELGGLFVISATGFPKTNLNDVIDAVDIIIDSLTNEPVDDRELEKVKNIEETSFESRTQTIHGKAELLNHYRTFFNNTSLVNEDLNNYLNVSAKEIQDVIKKYLNKENRVILYYLPKNVNN